MSDELEKALEKYDEKTKERLAKKITSFADEATFSSTQRHCILALKVVCPIALFFSTPIVAFLYTQLEKGLDQMVFVFSLIPLAFLALISAIVNFVLKTPN